MTVEQFNNLTEIEKQNEINRCKSFEYFYNNYCKKEGMPEFSQKVWDEYLESAKKQRFSRRRDINTSFYPFTPEESYKIK